ncbi:MAG: SWIM zinc finger family protein, partial [Dehalococcoidia bacterium]|nr:SWIM zinc finger family protein [Dehalococcoidia bacterium]
MDARQERGLQIAALAKIERNPLGWKVPSQSGNGSYVVRVEGEKFCTCPDFAERKLPCKHIFAVEYVIQRETGPDGSTTYTEAVRVTYRLEWTAYNKA